MIPRIVLKPSSIAKTKRWTKLLEVRLVYVFLEPFQIVLYNCGRLLHVYDSDEVLFGQRLWSGV